MTKLATARAKLIGLFVDDGRFAGAVALWLCTAWLVLPRLGLPPALPAPILFAGLAAILVWGAVRQKPTPGRAGSAAPTPHPVQLDGG